MFAFLVLCFGLLTVQSPTRVSSAIMQIERKSIRKQFISKEGDKVLIVTEISGTKSFVIEFKLGEEFDEVTFDGRHVKSVVRMDGKKLVHTQKWAGKEATLVREMKDGKMIMTLTFRGVESIRKYMRITEDILPVSSLTHLDL